MVEKPSFKHGDHKEYMQVELMAEHADGLADFSMEACLQIMYQQDGPLSGQCCSMPPASARALADPTGLASHALHAGSATCGRTTGTSSCQAVGPVAGSFCGEAPLGSPAFRPGLLLGFVAPGAPKKSHVRPQRPAWLEEAAQRMSHGIGLSRRFC